jgi:hypothetical protein
MERTSIAALPSWDIRAVLHSKKQLRLTPSSDAMQAGLFEKRD